MSGLNTSLAYFFTVIGLSALVRVLLARWRRRLGFLIELISAFALAGCRLEIETIAEVGQWAGALGPDVTYTMLFIAIAIHAFIMQGVSGNPAATVMGFLQKEIGVVAMLLSVASQFLGAFLGLLVAGKYWEMELTDMHMIKNLMMSECSTALRAPMIHGAVAEAISAMTFYLVYLILRNRTQLLRIPILALLLTFFAYAGSNYTSGIVNPSLAFALTFNCPGHTFSEYALVYWLGPLIGMTLGLFLYLGNIPLLFNRNLLYSKKSRFRVPKGKNSEEKAN
ncbi:aquaporin 12 [Triplophysa dalaica]|uniref:aquaporin 12 n=1 Tax=Triplophysa dalaica TaxID=1582913 RepID=UPI0024DFEDCD|nr:aquaporin 12 [Triplophysa dalaica]